ncbi:MAG: Polysaccharide export outer membrane protein [uncultured Sulfurovum sp.]|uniref:Polysaccharide export outer membrane protein n=1 Tax=uncultured Sulfurovum sp. TaxID=269237 RepID=A0A6S6SYP5_9BACT|nr:MAG: Polysaccharide export outer membrane protein [uncultured Sulfurovum sp.]
MKYYILLILILTFTGCSSKDDYVLFNKQHENKKEITTKLNNVAFEYKILPHDRISIIVYKHPELSSTTIGNGQFERGILVNSKGYLRLPLIKKIRIAGLSQTEAEEAISEAYSVYLKHPDIQIEVINKRAYVIGEVATPGEVPLLNERLTLLQLIAKAGDMTTSADRSSILILKNGSRSKVNTKVVDLTDANSIITANLMIEPNDIVYVMPNSMKAFNTRVEEISPVFQVISNILQPFVNIKFLTDN